jgi:hypothetical protein
MAVIGRPIEFTEQLADEICELLADGLSMRKICKADDRPNRRTIERWMGHYPEFAAKCARAREWQADYMADLVFDTAQACTPETAQAAKVQIGAYQWRAAKLAPKVYGDKTDVTVKGPNNGPIQSVTATIPISDPIEASKAYQKLMGDDK